MVCCRANKATPFSSAPLLYEGVLKSLCEAVNTFVCWPGSSQALQACRAGLVEYHRRALMAMMALHSANSPLSAARLLDRCHT